MAVWALKPIGPKKHTASGKRAGATQVSDGDHTTKLAKMVCWQASERWIWGASRAGSFGRTPDPGGE